MIETSQTPRTTLGVPQGRPPDWLRGILAANEQSPIYVPAEIPLDLVMHWASLWDPLTRRAAPRVLAYTGPPGTGKSATIREALRRLDVHVEEIPASSLESEMAGRPGELLRAALGRAAARQAKKQPVTLYLDELDLALGDFGATPSGNHQYTMSAFMEIADGRTGNVTDPIPMIVTANNLSRVYPVATREGRLRIRRWRLNDRAFARIVGHIHRSSLSDRQIEWLLDGRIDGPRERNETTEMPVELRKPETLAEHAQLQCIIQETRIRRLCDRLPPRPVHAILRGDLRSAGRNTITDEDLSAALLRFTQEREGRQDFTAT